jgi:hypothetical protein
MFNASDRARMDGKVEVMGVSVDGEVKGFLTAEADAATAALIDANQEEETLRELNQRKQVASGLGHELTFERSSCMSCAATKRIQNNKKGAYKSRELQQMCRSRPKCHVRGL